MPITSYLYRHEDKDGLRDICLCPKKKEISVKPCSSGYEQVVGQGVMEKMVRDQGKETDDD